LDSLYRTATEEEAHAMVADWLRKTIAELEHKSEGSSSATMATRCGEPEH